MNQRKLIFIVERFISRAKELDDPEVSPELTRYAFDHLYFNSRLNGIEWPEIGKMMKEILSDGTVPFNLRRGYFNRTPVDDVICGYTPNEGQYLSLDCPLDRMTDDEAKKALQEEQSHIDDIRKKEQLRIETNTMPSWFWQRNIDDDREYLKRERRL